MGSSMIRQLDFINFTSITDEIGMLCSNKLRTRENRGPVILRNERPDAFVLESLAGPK